MADSADDSKYGRRELFGTRLGFILAAVGSAVGLGNMWRFPYVTAESGGAAFVVLYILMVFLIGVPVILAEFTIGRGTGLSPIGALRALGGRTWAPLGYLFVFVGFLILAYYSVIAGWVVRYLVAAIFTGFPEDPGAYFGEVSSGWQAAGYHVLFMLVTIGIVIWGIERGIERASLIMMPTLFLVIIGLAVWVIFLPGSSQGYSFYLDVSFEELFKPRTLAEAAGQAFFSLSLGMGAMLTFSSYLSKKESLPRNGVVIAMSDFSVAFLAGLVVFPLIFALGLQADVGDNAIGALFISIPGAFVAMGPAGRIVGILFFFVLLVGAVTSAISLLEVVTASAIDELKVRRRVAALVMGLLVTALGILPALTTGALDVMDSLASEVLLPFGGLALAIFVGWFISRPLEEVSKGVSERVKPLLKVWLWLLRVLAPVAIVVVLTQTLPEAYRGLVALISGSSE